MIGRTIWGLAIALALLAAVPASAAPERLVADLSQKHVQITSGYHGTELLMFGAFEGADGDDVVLVVSGPEIRLAQRRSDKVAGIWVNVETNIWDNAPGFYHVFSTRPLGAIAAASVLRDARIGSQALPLTFMPQDGDDGGGHNGGTSHAVNGPSQVATSSMISGLARNMRDLGLWAESVEAVSVQQNMLFRATLNLPRNVPTGPYQVRVVHFRDGQIISEQTTDMTIRRAGFSATVYNFAHEYSALYGLFAIAFAVVAGWLAAAIFRRK